DALDGGADVVITGRVADAALFLGAAAHAHGWRWDDWDRLAAGTLIGHLLECSGQVAGGNYSGEWWTIPHPWDLPYPIAEVEPDGSAVITKPKDSGGRVDFDTVRHQLLYEVHDPAAYLAPDVVADFTSAAFTDLGSDRAAAARAARSRDPGRVALRRRTHGGRRRSRAHPADAVRPARRLHRHGPTGRGPADRAARHLAHARRSEARRREGARDVRGGH